MSHQIYCVAETEEQAKEFVGRFRAMGVEPEKVAVVSETAEVDLLVHPDAKHFHDMKNGALVGAFIGLGYGVATLAVIGAKGIPGVFEAFVLLGFAALGGILFGGIIGSTGLFSKPVMAPSIAHEYETEISHGKLLISVVARDEKERDEFMEVMNHWGASDIHHSGEAVA